MRLLALDNNDFLLINHKTQKMKQLPAEFIALNELVHRFNTGNNVKLFGEGFYILLQGSRVKGYSLYLMSIPDGKKVVKSLVFGANKKGILDALDLMERITFPNAKPEHHILNT